MLIETRKKYGLSQLEAAHIIGVPIRTYRRYETDETYGNNIKRNAFIASLNEACNITESKGIYTIEQIKIKCQKVFTKYKDEIDFCYLFGSYAKNYAKDDSDVDLLISTKLTGFDFLALVADLKNELNKKVDLLRFNDLKDNIDLLNEIMKDGVKIYG